MQPLIVLLAMVLSGLLAWQTASLYGRFRRPESGIIALLAQRFGETFGPQAKRLLPDLCARYDDKLRFVNSAALPRDGATFLGAAFGFALLMFVVLVGMTVLAGISFFVSLFLSLTFGAVGFLGTLRVLQRLLDARTKALDREFPYFFDFIVMTKQAGAILTDAISMYVDAADHSMLAREMDDLVSNKAKGPGGILGALRSYCETCPSEVGKTALMAIIAAEPAGAESGATLSSLAAEMRHDRMQKAERAAEGIRSRVMMPATLMLLGVIVIILSGSLPQMLFAF